MAFRQAKAAKIGGKFLSYGKEEAQKLFHDHAQMIIQKAFIQA